MGQVPLWAGRARILAYPPNLNFLLQRRTEFLRRYLKAGERVLEIGAGFGIVSLYVDKIKVVSTDLHCEKWIRAAADAMSLPFRDSAFDAVVCLNVLHHLPYPRRAIEEMVRVVCPGGVLLIAEPHASLLMRMVLWITGHEYIDWKADPLGTASCQTRNDKPRGGNNAIGDLLFGNLARFQQAFPYLRVEDHRFSECLTFLNSGGVGFRVPCIPLPQFALKLVGKIDSWLMKYPRVFPLCREVVLRQVNTT